GQLPERTLLSRHRKHARAIADSSFHNSPSYPSAAADHDHVFACQWKHSGLLMCKTGMAVENHRWLAGFFASGSQAELNGPLVLSLQSAPKTGPESAFGGRRDVRRPPPCVQTATSIDAAAYTRERAKVEHRTRHSPEAERDPRCLRTTAPLEAPNDNGPIIFLDSRGTWPAHSSETRPDNHAINARKSARSVDGGHPSNAGVTDR